MPSLQFASCSLHKFLPLAAGLLVTAAAIPAAHAADWPQYRGANGDAHSAEKDVAKHFSAQPKIAWKVPIGEGFGTFAVAGGKAFIFVDRSGRETLLCMDAETGKEIWARPVDGTISDNSGGSNPRSTPAISGDKVYVYSVNLKLVCMTIADGKEVWTHDIKNEMKGHDSGGWGNAISPVVEGDRVFVAGGGPGKSMAAFNKDDGKLIWAVGTEKVTHASPTPATIGGVKQMIYFLQSGLVSVAQEDGKELWRGKFPYKVSTAASPIVGSGKDEGLVYCSAGYGVGSAVFKVTKADAGFKSEEVWFQKSDAGTAPNVNHWSTPLYYDGYIYGIFGFKDFAGHGKGGGPVRCMEMATGKFKWSEPGFGSGGGTSFVDGQLLVQGDAGKLSMIEATPEGYKETATFQVPGEKFWCAAIVADGKIFTRSKTEAYCIDVSK